MVFGAGAGGAFGVSGGLSPTVNGQLNTPVPHVYGSGNLTVNVGRTLASGTFYEGSGCFECGGTGIRGRSAIHELLDLSERIREMILNRRPASEIRRAAREEGMTFLRESALEKARAGVTTLKEINKVTFIEV